ncbi:outer membrane beta-barrel protein [Flagellimonas crocea]|uniref:outer membrane beta-barrel protein n=1 Tax=Flagellimonas crocea TaxID=3067311 RepID=UPI00296FBAC8|nr:outer membrane beta-barrel protein [Muricauda sp. DH64]
MGKKNLEQLFKERFQDFQEVPDEKVWSAIEVSLDKRKQKKRAIPIWWGLGGAAAALAILLLTINPFADETLEDQIITNRENTVTPEQHENLKNNSEDSENSLDNVKKDALVNTTDNSEQLDKKKNNSTSNSPFNNDDNGDQVSENTASNVASTRFSQQKQDAPDNLGVIDKNAAEAERDNITKEAIAMNRDGQKPSEKIIEKAKGNEAAIAQNESNESVKADEGKKSIYDAIQEQEDLEKDVAENKGGKWSAGPSLAPVYFNAAGDGSPVGPDFSSNSKSGKLNLSYGVTVAYEVGEKLKIRSGVHRVNYGYSTNDVLFSSTLNAAAASKIANIDYNEKAASVIVQSRESSKNTFAVNSKEIALTEAPVLDGKMIQQLGYIEVPLEINYAILDKKFGVDLIGGVSSLFLVDNSVLLESEQLVTEMGEANNINSMNFSANLGMGLNYRFNPKIRFNIEPVFKYQLNTFSNVSGNFQPYSIGVYSGFSFRF